MSTDRELLELAAKAVGIEIQYQPGSHRFLYEKDLPSLEGKYLAYWNPLTDDGDALRLAVKLGVALDFFYAGPIEKPEWQFTRARRFESQASVGRPGDIDPYAATRRAIVMAAAEIGKTQCEK